MFGKNNHENENSRHDFKFSEWPQLFGAQCNLGMATSYTMDIINTYVTYHFI